MNEFSYAEQPGAVDEASPLIYLWEVSDGANVIYRYVGKAQRGARPPRTHYRRNVRNLLRNLPYRPGNRDGYREVHRQLACAVRNGHDITLRFVRNVEPGEDIYCIEREEQERYGCT
jgi:hypothetical protein